MANKLYEITMAQMIQGNIDLVTDTIDCALIDTGTYTFSQTHDFYDDVSGVVDTPVEITSRTATLGVFDGADITFTAVSGSTVEALIIYKDTGVAGTSNLLAYIDTGVTGLPLTPNGGDVDVTWNASGIIRFVTT